MIIKLDPTNIDAFNFLAHCKFKSAETESELKNVEKYYLRVLEIDKEHILSNFNIGTYYFARRQYKKALAHFKLAYDKTENDTKLAYQIGMC